jgi:hypothetical protein
LLRAFHVGILGFAYAFTVKVSASTGTMTIASANRAKNTRRAALRFDCYYRPFRAHTPIE